MPKPKSKPSNETKKILRDLAKGRVGRIPKIGKTSQLTKPLIFFKRLDAACRKNGKDSGLGKDIKEAERVLKLPDKQTPGWQYVYKRLTAIVLTDRLGKALARAGFDTETARKTLRRAVILERKQVDWLEPILDADSLKKAVEDNLKDYFEEKRRLEKLK